MRVDYAIALVQAYEPTGIDETYRHAACLLAQEVEKLTNALKDRDSEIEDLRYEIIDLNCRLS